MGLERLKRVGIEKRSITKNGALSINGVIETNSMNANGLGGLRLRGGRQPKPITIGTNSKRASKNARKIENLDGAN